MGTVDANDYDRRTLLRRARQLQADLEVETQWWDDELGFPLCEAALKLLRTLERSEWHLIEALSQELVARLEAAEEAGKVDESTVTHYEVQLTGLRLLVVRVEQQQRADAVVRELLDG
jgi:hypothetical protein